MTENRVGCTLVTQKSICCDRKKNKLYYKGDLMYRIQLDIMATTTLEDLIDILDECEQSIDDHPIKFKLIEKSGPGGGNPVIEFYSRDEWNLKRVAEKILGHKISLTEFSDFLN